MITSWGGQLMLSPNSMRRSCSGCSASLYEKMPEVATWTSPSWSLFDEAIFSSPTRRAAPAEDRADHPAHPLEGVGVFSSPRTSRRARHRIGQLEIASSTPCGLTPRDQKAVKAAAETLRANPKFDVAKTITELAVGEALVSFLDEKGQPGWSSGLSSAREEQIDPSLHRPDGIVRLGPVRPL